MPPQTRFAAALMAAALFAATVCARAGADEPPRAPEFTAGNPDAWINSTPLTLADVEGKVVLLDVWTFECWNCYRSIPWLKSLEARFAKERFQIIGIHTPEFDREKARAAVVAAVGRFGIAHPVMMDNDLAYWNALGNRYWPAFYVLDRKGRMRGRFVGETHSGDARAARIEALISALLAE